MRARIACFLSSMLSVVRKGATAVQSAKSVADLKQVGQLEPVSVDFTHAGWSPYNARIVARAK